MSFVRISSLLSQRQTVSSNKQRANELDVSYKRTPIEKKSWSKTGTDLAAAMTTTFFETIMFYPFDTAKIRLQHHTGSIVNNNEALSRSLSKIIFANKAEAGFSEKMRAMYTGLGWAVAYKVVQRTIKLGLQPTLKANLQHQFGNEFQRVFGKNSHVAMHIAASVPLSWLELFFLCFDTLKIKRQTDIDAYKNRSVVDIMRNENLFGRAFWVSASRTTLGTSFFFGMPIVVKQAIFNLDPEAKMTTFQNLVTSAAAGGSAVLVVNPFDVVKTRMVAMRLSKHEKVTGINTAINIAKAEGARAFSKGLATALLCNWPRSTFAMFTVNKLRDVFSERMCVKSENLNSKRKI